MKPKLVLLVEDDNDDEVLMIRALKKNKIANEVVVVRDGVEALDFLFATGPHSGRDAAALPDVVLLDLQMPRLGGLDVLRKIRADERTRLLPVVVLTSSKEDKDILEAYKLGADSFVQKSMVLMIDDLLNLTRITRRKVKHEEVDLTTLAAEVAADLKRLEPGQNVEFKVQDGLRTLGDSDMLRTLLASLIGNCWKYGSGRPGIKVEFGSTAVDGRDAFFVRGTGEFTGKSRGLTSVNRIVSRHGGRVWSKSGADKNPTFYFTLHP